MQIRLNSLGATLAMASMLGALAVPNAALASSKGRKNTAIGLGAAAAQQLLTGKTRNGILLGAGAAYAYKRYKDSERDENRRKRSASYRSNTYRNRTATGTTRSRSRYGAANTNGRLYSGATSGAPAGSYYFTGTVINDASELTNRKITVDHSGVSRRVSIPKSATVLHAGQQMSMHELRKGDIVRVRAVRNEDNWTASRVELLNAVDADAAVANRDTFGDSYTRSRGSSTATTTRTGTSRYSGVGVIERIATDGRSFDVRVGTNLRTVYVEDARFSGISSTADLREGDRVRVAGDLDGRDVAATEVTLVE